MTHYQDYSQSLSIDGKKGQIKYITTEGVRFRERPNGQIIRDLTIGEKIIDFGFIEDSWKSININGIQGVVFEKYIRKPMAPSIESLLRVTLDEWVRFNKGQADEKADPYFKYVGEMWNALGLKYDGRSVDHKGTDIPWSAAFISWVVRQAGPQYANFKFSASHSVFVNNAIKARIINNLDKPFWGYKINEVKPELGDIIQRNRNNNNYSYSFAENHTQYESHSDIVVEVTPDVVRVIGGNVKNTVSMKGDIQEYDLDEHGLIRPNQKVICILKNRTANFL